jgi:RNA polymerase sigma factor (sigma-70 family)
MNKTERDLPNVEKVINYQIRNVGRKSPLTYEEMFQLGYIGYLTAQKNYKADFGQMTMEYATYFIRAEILNAIKKEKLRRTREVKILYKAPDAFDDYLDTFIEEYPQPDTSSDVNLDRLPEVLEALEGLTDIERDIIESTHLNHDIKELKYIADKYNKDIRTVYYIKSNAVKKLKAMLR